ncbi:MAG: hypothetical protein QXE76_04905 [Candidatus Bathyarchaeia archaeon]
MIQQLPITTTPKYNFPQTTQNFPSPQRFIEISLQTLKTLKGQTLTQQESDTPPVKDESPIRPEEAFTIRPIPLKPLPNNTPVIATDVSSIKLGETDDGILIALRGAIVWKTQQKYHYLRIGPFPFHITEENKHEIHRLLNPFPNETTKNEPNLLNMQNRVASFFEHWLQMSINMLSKNSLILWDGSLTIGTPESPTALLLKLLETAHMHGNIVLAFSKMTRLRLNGQGLTELVWKYPPPCLLEINGFRMSSYAHSLGNLYVAKLSQGNCAFRLDIDKQIPKNQAVEAIEKLLEVDVLLHGYPETLRLSHILSTFTANEVIALQRFITKECRLEITTKPNVRRVLFGPFGKSPEG